MKNRVVRQLLTMCMVVSLAVSTPMMSWANETEAVEQKSNESDIINISEKGAKTSIYEDKKSTIAVESADYTLDASNIVLTLEIKNMYPNILTVKIQNAKVDNAQTAFKWDTNDYKAGDICDSCWYIMLEDLQETNNTDFKQLSFTMTGTLNDGTEIFSKNIIIDRNAFKSLADEDDEASEAEVTPEATEEVAEEPDKNTEMSDTKNDFDKDNSDIEARLSTLEENTKELEEKNEELESQYNDLKDENEKLKKQNKKLKKQVKKLQTSQDEADVKVTTTQEESTSAAETEETEAKTTEAEDTSSENIQKASIPDQYIEKEDVYGDDGKLSFTYQYEYNDKYQLIEKKCVYPDGSVTNDEKYAYDKNGNKIREDHEDNKDSSYSYYTEYEYEDGNLIKSTTYKPTDNSIKYTFSYSYDDQNRIIQENMDNIEYDNKATTNYFYDDKNNIIYTERNNERYEDYTYDTNGNLISQMRSNGTGTEWKYENNIKVEETYYYEGELLYTSKLEYASTNPSTAVISDAEIIKVVQQALNDAGYNCGTPDGILGDGTRNAVKNYMESNGKSSNGEITEELVGMLNINDKIKTAKELSKYRTDISYDMLMRNPVDYINTPVKFSGSVVQVINEGGGNNIRWAINSDSSQTIWCSYSKLDMSGNLMEGDQVTVYGIAMGTEDYIAITGEKITLPTITCERMDTSFGTFEKFPGF